MSYSCVCVCVCLQKHHFAVKAGNAMLSCGASADSQYVAVGTFSLFLSSLHLCACVDGVNIVLALTMLLFLNVVVPCVPCVQVARMARALCGICRVES